MRREDGQIKVLDFGLARWEPAPDTPSMTRLTQDGVALGTPGYMAPEQLGGGAVDARADLFSFGVVAWELASGEHPFGADPAAGPLEHGGDHGRAGGAARARRWPGWTRSSSAACAPPRPTATARPPRCSRICDGSRQRRGPRRSCRRRRRAPALWWWQFHQTSLAIVDAATPVLALLIRRSMGPPYGRWIFLGVLAVATIAVTLRLNLLFTSRVHASQLAAHRAPAVSVDRRGRGHARRPCCWDRRCTSARMPISPPHRC